MPPAFHGKTAQKKEAGRGFGLYVHWPFCLAKCPYCDFNSHVRETIDHKRWKNALLAEMTYFAERSNQGPERQLTSIFFGGGTPSLMEPGTVAAVIEKARESWPSAPDLEITLEANPTSSEAALFQAFGHAGVNRLSIGVQSLNDDALRFLGRKHTAKEAVAAIEWAGEAVPRISFDLIYARPGQSLADWKSEMRSALALGPAHISLYQLTIEEGTAFHLAWRRGDFSLPSEDEALTLFQETRDWLNAQGLPGYEVSNHARPGQACRHNLTYWRYGDYLGIGPGAHGRLTTAAGKLSTRQHRLPESWLKMVESDGHGSTRQNLLSRQERGQEMIMMGLRLSEGLDKTAFFGETGLELGAFLAEDRLTALQEAGFIHDDGQHLRVTPKGLSVLDSLLAYLMLRR